MNMTPECRKIIEEVRELETSRLISSPYKDRSGQVEHIPIIKEYTVSSSYDFHKINARFYKPIKRGLLPLIIFAHGGGWVYGNLETHDKLCRRLALRTKCSVLSVDYRLAPTYRFPIQLNDFQSVYEWVLSNQDTLEILNKKIIASGDSVGGNIVSSVTCRLIKEQKTVPKALILLYPIVDLTFFTRSKNQMKVDHLLTQEVMKSYINDYIRECDNPSDWMLSPLFFEEMEKFPTTIAITAQIDILTFTTKEFIKALAAHDVKTSYHSLPGVIHGFMNYHGEVAESEKALQLIRKELLDERMGI